jgi:hypothetical protein
MGYVSTPRCRDGCVATEVQSSSHVSSDEDDDDEEAAASGPAMGEWRGGPGGIHVVSLFVSQYVQRKVFVRELHQVRSPGDGMRMAPGVVDTSADLRWARANPFGSACGHSRSRPALQR